MLCIVQISVTMTLDYQRVLWHSKIYLIFPMIMTKIVESGTDISLSGDQKNW